MFKADDRLQALDQLEDATWSSAEAIYQRARTVLNTYKAEIESRNLDREKVNSRLSEHFFKEASILVEYR